MNWHDVLERAAWTAVQGSIAADTVLPAITDVTGWAVLGNAALIGGLSSLLSFIKTVAQSRLSALDTRAK